MAVDKLGIYNDALRIVGERKLSNLTEDRPPRYRLDDVYDLGAVDYCLEIAKPRFASKVVKLTSYATSSEHGLPNVFTLPGDYVAMVAPFSDDQLSEQVTRYVVEGQTIATDHEILYLRYMATNVDFANWPQSFARVVSSYLAREISPRISQTVYDYSSKKLEEAVDAFMSSDQTEETRPRSQPKTATLSLDWLRIYNDALFIIGMPHLISVNDDSQARATLDAAREQSIVAARLEDTQWSWATTSLRLTYNPSLEPEWGYQRVFDKPANMQRIDGIFYDEYMRSPLKLYGDEGDYFYADVDEAYLQFVSSDLIDNPASWPAYFKKLIAADLAVAVVSTLEGDVNKAMAVQEDRERGAFSTDATASPPRKISSGNWTRARGTNTANRDRP